MRSSPRRRHHHGGPGDEACGCASFIYAGDQAVTTPGGSRGLSSPMNSWKHSAQPVPPTEGGGGRRHVSKMLRAPGSLEAVTLTPLHALHPADADHLLRLGVKPGRRRQTMTTSHYPMLVCYSFATPRAQPGLI